MYVGGGGVRVGVPGGYSIPFDPECDPRNGDNESSREIDLHHKHSNVSFQVDGELCVWVVS